MICFVAFARGDPHLVTLDGLRYTFNGRGEYTLIQTTDNVFTLQGRMTTASGVNETTVDATVFSAIAAKDNNSDTVQFEVDENKTLIATVSGELVIFDIAEQDFEKVTVQHLGSDTIEALFASGAYVKAKAENGFISSLQVILPESFSGQVQGLLGTFNGDTSDDLFPQFGDKPLLPDSSVEDIHNLFGVTCELMSLQCKSLMRKKRVSFIIVRCPYCKSGIIIIVEVRKGVFFREVSSV